MKKTLFFLINLILIVFLGCITVSADETDAFIYNAPEEIRGVVVSPGEDFATETGQSADTVKGQIDNIIYTVSSYGLNTIFLNVQHRNGTIYISDSYPVYTSFDALEYFAEKCKQNEIYLYAIINPAMIAAKDEKNALEAIKYANLELGFSGALYNRMLETNALMGRQTEENDKYKVSWTYHPDDGLEVTYEEK